MWLPFLCEKSGAIALELLGLMAGWLAGRWNSAKFGNFLNNIPDGILEFSLYLTKVQCYYSCTNVLSGFFT